MKATPAIVLFLYLLILSEFACGKTTHTSSDSSKSTSDLTSVASSESTSGKSSSLTGSSHSSSSSSTASASATSSSSASTETASSSASSSHASSTSASHSSSTTGSKSSTTSSTTSTVKKTGCSKNTDCKSCNSQESCVWCQSASKCIVGGPFGPHDGLSSCSDWRYKQCNVPGTVPLFCTVAGVVLVLIGVLVLVIYCSCCRTRAGKGTTHHDWVAWQRHQEEAGLLPKHPKSDAKRLEMARKYGSSINRYSDDTKGYDVRAKM